MKLYDAPRNSKICVMDDQGEILKDSQGNDLILDYKNIDGMYSLCYDQTGIPVHIAAWSDVEVLP